MAVHKEKRNTHRQIQFYIIIEDIKTTSVFCFFASYVVAGVCGAVCVCFHIQQEIHGQDGANEEERYSSGDVAS